VAALAAQGTKRVTLELGGSDPMIICDDADLAKAASAASMGRFYNCGQACLAIKRVYVFDGVADEVIAAIAQKAGRLRVGIGTHEGVHRAAAPSRQRALLRTARAHARARRRGRRRRAPERPRTTRLVPRPTVVVDPPHPPMATERSSARCCPSVGVRDLDEALALANASPFGSGSSVWTRDLDRAERALRPSSTAAIPGSTAHQGLRRAAVGGEGQRLAERLGGPDHYSDLKAVVVGRGGMA
jgi:succinate-semialdehyde dehydrogenase/glutarate-semialdehyde dehydrogenase